MIKALLTRIEEAARVVVFTGAGISTESGIPDFRSPGGVWTRYAPIYFNEFVASVESRREAWRRKFELDETLLTARPNKGHRAIARLAHLGKVSHVITQNIDNLHQESGLTENQVIELHGNGTYATCLDCGARHELEAIKAVFLVDEVPPVCRLCGGIVKSATISFGQAMPDGPMRRAREATLACDLFLAIGSSLQVYPAAGFPILARRNGADLVILNREPTPLDDIAGLVIHEEIGPLLAQVARLNDH